MIDSFKIDHTKLERGVYLSRLDSVSGRLIATYDIRVCRPYLNDSLSPEVMHTIEHIGATVLRNGAFGDKIIYFGPMGCGTGFYLIMKGDNLDLATELTREVFTKISNWDKEIPGATRRECGNYISHNLEGARRIAKIFLNSEWKHEYPR